jgi:hypothetical protein
MKTKVTVERLKEYLSTSNFTRKLNGEKRFIIRLSAMAEFINENFPEYDARMEKWWGSFDRKISGTRLVSKGNYRECMELVVYDKKTGRKIFDHNPIEAYSSNWYVASWILGKLEEREAHNVL